MAVSRLGWFDLTWTISWQLATAAQRNVFLTVHGIGGDDTTSQAEFTDEALDSRDFVGFVINLDMPEDQG